MTWHCEQIPNGVNPIVVCERSSLAEQILKHEALLAEAQTIVARIRELDMGGMRGRRLLDFNYALGDLLELIELGEPSEEP